MSDDTRNRIIEAGAEIIHLHGFQGTGLKAILDAASVPKGSFYHYFKSKEDFGIAVIEYYEELGRNIILPILQDTSLTTIERFLKMFTRFREINEQHHCARGCLLANLSQEMAALSEPIRIRLNESYKRTIEAFANVIREGQEKDEIRADISAEDAATFIHFSRNGAMVNMKVSGSVEPLIIFERMIMRYILSA